MTTPVKIYATSIVTSDPLEPIRDTKVIASSTVVEVLHVLVFVILISFIFGKAWKVATEADRKAKARKMALNEQKTI